MGGALGAAVFVLLVAAYVGGPAGVIGIAVVGLVGGGAIVGLAALFGWLGEQLKPAAPPPKAPSRPRGHRF